MLGEIDQLIREKQSAEPEFAREWAEIGKYLKRMAEPRECSVCSIEVDKPFRLDGAARCRDCTP